MASNGLNLGMLLDMLQCKELSKQISVVPSLSPAQYSMPQVRKSNINLPSWSQAMILHSLSFVYGMSTLLNGFYLSFI